MKDRMMWKGQYLEEMSAAELIGVIEHLSYLLEDERETHKSNLHFLSSLANKKPKSIFESIFGSR